MDHDSPTPRVPPSPIELKEIYAAERAGAPFLLWRTNDGRQQLLKLPSDRLRVTIGRDPDADVSLEWDREVSRTHALLERVGNSWTLIDDGFSRNGSFVNGARVIGRRRLAERDRLCLGVTELTYREPSPRGSDSTITAADGVSSARLSPRRREVLIALCRPVHDGQSPIPATNRQVADEVFLTVEAVKAHLRGLFESYGIGDLPQNEKRARLVDCALRSGDLTPRDF